MNKYAYAKVNIFLKMSGKRGDYHELVSRFVRVKSKYDIIGFAKGANDTFKLEGEFGCPTEKNTIYKAYKLLCEVSPKVEEFFKSHFVRVFKNIPEFAGLGGGSSNAATFMLMVNEACELGLSTEELVKIGVQIGADVPFFLYDVDSANVSGIGEVVEPFEDELPQFIGTNTPPIRCNTGEIYAAFDKDFYKEISSEDAEILKSMKTTELLEKYTKEELNDLYEPALSVYPMLIPENFGVPEGAFFSGSGSSFFFEETFE
jgi:4-diphosphocytidyl-2-C-methyl-D-erythritol kinase